MSANKKPQREALDRLADALVDDILNASDEEILEEFREDGGDPEQHAAEMLALFEKSVTIANKRRLAEAATAAAADRAAAARRPPAPPIDIQVRYELTPSPALPIPGKGENAWDCDDDAIFGMTVNADTLEDAARSLVDSVCKTRLQYGGATWQPPEGWPV